MSSNFDHENTPNDMEDRAVEKVFAGLRDAASSPGMERRIAHAVQALAAVPPTSAWERFEGGFSSRPIRLIAILGTVAFALFIVALARTPSLQKKPAALTSRQTTAIAAPMPGSTITIEAAVPPSRVLSTRKPEMKEDQETVEASSAVSFPAPPLPLTEQERLLLRVAHRSDPANLALLNPEKQAVLIASEHAEFEKFFAQSPPIQNEVNNEGQFK